MSESFDPPDRTDWYFSKVSLKQILDFHPYNDFINWLNIAMMIVLLLKGIPSYGIAFIIYGIVNCILVLYELVQAYSIGLRNYFNFWNIIDLLRTGCCIIWMVIAYKIGESRIECVSYIMVLLNF